MDRLLQDLNLHWDLDPYCYKMYLFFVLFKHKYNSTRVSLSQLNLAKETNISKKAVQRALKCLQQKNIIIIHSNRGKNIPDSYEINF